MRMANWGRLLLAAGSVLLLTAASGSAAAVSVQDEAEEPELLYQEIPVSSFRVSGLSPQTDTGLDYVDMWYSEREDCRYLFLPATADRRHLTITYAAEGKLTLNRIPVNSGYETALLSLNDTFQIEVNDTDCGTLKVMQSTLGCAYLELASGGVEYTDKHRYGTDTGTALMLDAEGNVQYYGGLEKFHGHGNSSFDYSVKKPYNIKLETKASLYGMGKAKRWALISNFLDQSMMRNTVFIEASRQAGVEAVLNSEYIDLFANGSYRGTYQLYERPEIRKTRINIRDLEEETENMNTDDLSLLKRQISGEANTPGSYHYYNVPNEPEDLTGGYLLQFQFAGRAKKSDFILSRGQCVEINSPEYASQAQTEYIRAFMQELEDAVYSKTGYNQLGKHYSEYIDVDSFILGYLIQELSENSDSLCTSFYLYKDSDSNGDGKLHYGPAWDFDLSCMNFSRSAKDPDGFGHSTLNPNDFFAKYLPGSSADPDATEEETTVGNSWITMLWKQPDFLSRTAELYLERIDPYVLETVDTEHPENSVMMQTYNKLKVSAELNNARWHMCGPKSKPLGPFNGNNYEECTDYVRQFLNRRQAFLHEQFLTIYRDLKSEALTDAVSKKDPERYAEEEQQAIGRLLEDGQAAILEAETTEAVRAAYDSAIAAIEALPRAEYPGDFDENKAVEIKDAQAVLICYAHRLAGLDDRVSATQLRNADVDKNGRLDALDAMHILIHCSEALCGNDYPLPVQDVNGSPD